ncbi:MAG: hypothetical protein ACRD0G_17300 [Acidimicrobiales bacterium]
MKIKGRWRIVEMELWDQDAIDLLGPAYIEIGPRNDGTFRFIAVEGWMDIRRVEHDGVRAIEFSWDGNDEGDPANGRGCATLHEDGSLSGRIYFHNGDDSAFRAVGE